MTTKHASQREMAMILGLSSDRKIREFESDPSVASHTGISNPVSKIYRYLQRHPEAAQELFDMEVAGWAPVTPDEARAIRCAIKLK